MANHLRRIISTPSLGLGGRDRAAAAAGGGCGGTGGHTVDVIGNNAFSPSSKDAGLAKSTPNSRSSSPTPFAAADSGSVGRGDANVEAVMTKSGNLTLLDSSEQQEEEGGTRGGRKRVELAGAPSSKTPPDAASESSIDVLHEEAVVAREDGMDLPKDDSLVEAPVKVIGLGFITRMADYMVAADVLVSKAGRNLRGRARGGARRP